MCFTRKNSKVILHPSKSFFWQSCSNFGIFSCKACSYDIFIASSIIDSNFEELYLFLYLFDVYKNYIPMFFKKREIIDKMDNNF